MVALRREDEMVAAVVARSPRVVPRPLVRLHPGPGFLTVGVLV